MLLHNIVTCISSLAEYFTAIFVSAIHGSMRLFSYSWALHFRSDRFLPDKAIDLIDEAGSKVRLKHAQVFRETIDLSRACFVIPCLPY